MNRFILTALALGCCAAAWAQMAPESQNALSRHAHAIIRQKNVVITIENTTEMRIESEWTVTILSEKGEYHNVAVLSDDAFSKIKKLEGALYDGTGKLIRKSEKSDLIHYGGNASYEFSEDRIKALRLTSNQFPYTVQFKTEEKIKGFFRIPEQVIQRLGEAVAQTSVTLVAPKDYGFSWKLSGLPGAPKKSINGDTQTWSWQFESLPAPKDEPDNPYFRSIFAQLLLAPHQVKIDDYEGRFTDWKSIGAFFNQLNQNRNVLSAESAGRFRAMTASAQTTREKVAILYRYLQENHRYVSIQIGIGGWQTFDATFVERNKYGDCKALSNYMSAMLKACGIESQLALIYGDSEEFPELYQDLCIPQFNHMILYLPGEDTWLECTSQDAPMGYLGDFTGDRPALLLTEEGGRLVRTPALQAEDNMRRQTAQIQLDEKGNAVVQTRIEGQGNYQDYYRRLALEKDPEARQKTFTEYCGVPVAILQQLDCQAEPTPRAFATATFESRNYAKVTGKRMFVPLLRLHPIQHSLPEDSSRIHPLVVNDAFTHIDTFHLQLPPGYEVENLPAGSIVDSEFGRYECQITREAERIIVCRKAVYRAMRLPPEKYQALRRHYQEVGKLESVQMVLKKL